MVRYDVYSALLFVATIGSILVVRHIDKKRRGRSVAVSGIERFLAGGGSRRKNKPIIWIHVDTETNARFWKSFGSRNTTCLNAPYKLICIRSIIERNSDDFDVCVVSDNAISSIVGNERPNLEKISDPARGYYRRFYMAQILHEHGGIWVPSSFMCARSLYGLYLDCGDSVVAAEQINRSIDGDTMPYGPSCEFMGCSSGEPRMETIVRAYEAIARGDSTNTSNFDGAHTKALIDAGAKIVPATMVGVAARSGVPITIDDLAGSITIDIEERAYGVWFPSQEISERTAYQWMSRLSPAQVLNADTELGKISLALS